MIVAPGQIRLRYVPQVFGEVSLRQWSAWRKRNSSLLLWRGESRIQDSGDVSVLTEESLIKAAAAECIKVQLL